MSLVAEDVWQTSIVFTRKQPMRTFLEIIFFSMMFSFRCLHQLDSCFIKPLKRRTSGWRCSKGMNSMFSSNGWIADFSGKCSDKIYIQSSYLEPVIINHGKVQMYQPLISWIFWHSRHLPHTPQKDSGGQTISFEICFDIFINQNRKPGISYYGFE